MPRRRLCRRVAAAPAAVYFKPQGMPRSAIGEAILAVEGLEALRLADLEGLAADAAAVSMGVSRHTFGRVLAEARTTVAQALVGGLSLRIEGGDYRLAGEEPATAESAGESCNAPTQTPAADQAHKEPSMPGRGNCGRSGQGQGMGQGRGQGQRNGAGTAQGQCPRQGAGQGRGDGQGRGAGRGRGLGQGRGLGRTAGPDQANGAGQGNSFVQSSEPQQATAMPAALAETSLCPGCGQTVVAVVGEAGPACPSCGLGLTSEPGQGQ